MSVKLDKCSVFPSIFQSGLFRLLGVSSFALIVGLSGCTVKPEPISQKEVENRVQTDLGRLFANQEPVSYRVGLHEAMARAIKYNLQRRVKQMEEALAVEDLALAERDLLPKTAVSAGYTLRNKEVVSSMKNSNSQLVSKDNKQGAANLTWTWSILDFGVSYVQARQKADQALIYREKRRKSTQLLIQEVRTRYWQAVMADLLVPQIDALLAEAKVAREDLLRMESAGQEVPAIALEKQQTLLDTTHQLWEMRRALVEAKSDLAVLMNLPPGTIFMMNVQAGEALNDELVYLPPMALDQYALLHRSELRGEDYKERITALEARKVLLEMLPNLGIMEGMNYDSNQSLQSPVWSSVGTRLSWDLFSLASTPKKMAVADMEKEVVRSRRLAFSMAAITQLRIALQSYHISKRDLSIATDLNQLQVRKVQQGEMDKNSISSSDVKRIELRALSLLAHIEQGMAFARLQSDLGRVHLSLGFDPLPVETDMDFVDIKTTAEVIAMRQSSVSSAVLSAIPPELLQATPASIYKVETETGSLSKGSAAMFWNTLEQFSARLDKQQSVGQYTGGQPGPPQYATTQSPGYLPPGGGAPGFIPPQQSMGGHLPSPRDVEQVMLTAD
ncbi:MAG: TolC family protein [Magnetococcales bacterium]|nr:TolC family protein [Magnetococcales bacterium]